MSNLGPTTSIFHHTSKQSCSSEPLNLPCPKHSVLRLDGKDQFKLQRRCERFGLSTLDYNWKAIDWGGRKELISRFDADYKMAKVRTPCIIPT
jgi:hypothetical protein